MREGLLGHDIKKVHIQSGTLSSAIYSTVRASGEVMTGLAGVDPLQAEHVKWVVKGTRKMIPRDFIGRGAIASRGKILKAIREGLNAAAAKAGAK